MPKNAPGLVVKPLRNILGTRGSMLAELTFTGCEIETGSLVGAPGFGLAAVATSALDVGRFSVAWGSVGIAARCLESTLAYVTSRDQGGAPLRDHQLVRRLVTDMQVDTMAARLLCLRAARLREAGDPGSIEATFVAKYRAATTAMRVAHDAVQLHGADGCTDAYPVARCMRDAKVMEIIEGSNEIQQNTIAEYAYRSVL